MEEQCSEVSAVVDGIILQDEPEMAEIEGHMLHLSTEVMTKLCKQQNYRTIFTPLHTKSLFYLHL